MRPAYMPEHIDDLPDALVIVRMTDRLVAAANRPTWPTNLADPIDVGLALAQAGFRRRQIDRLGQVAAAHARSRS